MISQEQADAVLARAAQEYMKMSYDELRRLDNRLSPPDKHGWCELPPITVDGEKYHISMLVGELPLFRRRICVEMILHSEDGTEWPRVPCVYFERFKSGRLHVVVTTKWENALMEALPYVFISAVVIGLPALVWHLFLRGG